MNTDRVPRYTSYPTAPHFHDGIGAAEYISWLRSLHPGNSLSLYFHIPYCRRLCWFCGCHTGVINHYEPVERYMKLLRQEVSMVSGHLARGAKVKHIHFGGGSPTILSADDFAEFMLFVADHFAIEDAAEIAVEIDPRTVNPDKIAAYIGAGVTRASIGVQDFNSEVQEAINRVQPYEMVKEVVMELRKGDITSLNMDLIYGLPYQSEATIKQTIEKTITLNPNRISLFGYAHVPWMKKHQQLMPGEALPSPEERLTMSELARQMLIATGYVAVGLDHFARADDSLAAAALNKTLQRNFQGYTTDNADALIGLGISSISSLPQGYVQNISGNVGYAQAIGEQTIPVARGIELSAEDKLRRAVIMSLMCNLQAEVEEELYSEEIEQLQPYIKSGDAEYCDGMLRINENSRSKMRMIASVFDSYMQNTSHRYSQAV